MLIGLLLSGHATPPATPALHLLSWNLNFGVSGDEEMMDFIAARDADLVLLQEADAEWGEALERRFDGRYSTLMFRDCCGAGGLGVMSRYPVRELEWLPSPVGWFPAWLLLVEAPTGPVQVLLVHLHPPFTEGGLPFPTAARQDRAEELALYLDFVDPELPLVVAGDFNERAGPALDLALEQGLVDATPPGDTWRWDTPVLTLEARLDHVLHSPGLVTLAAQIHEVGRSDHLPLELLLGAKIDLP